MAILGGGGFFTKGIGQKCMRSDWYHVLFSILASPPPKSTNFALRTHKNCLLVRFSLGLGFHAVTYTGWISFSVENKHSGSVYSYKSDRMLLHVFPGKNSIFLNILAKKTLNALFFEPFLLNQRIFISFMQFWKTNPSFLWEKFWFHPFLIFTILAICIFINQTKPINLMIW